MKGIIYKYTFSDGKVYIGQTRRDPAIRHKEHFDEKIGPGNKAFWEAYQRLGEPQYDVLEVVKCENKVDLIQILNQKETQYIKKFQSADPRYGYNKMPYATVSTGAEDVLHTLLHSVSYYFVKAQMEMYRTICEKLNRTEIFNEEEKKFFEEYFVSNIFYRGNYLSDYEDEQFYEEWFTMAKERMRDDALEEAFNYVEENKTQLLDQYMGDMSVLQIDNDGNIVGKYIRQSDAAEAMGSKSMANINNVLRGKQKTAHGYRWMYAKDYYNEQNLL